MSDAQRIMAEATELHQFIPCNHSSIGSEDHCSCGHRPYGWIAYAAHLSAEIDAALGGLARQWTVRYCDGDVIMRPSPGLPTQSATEIVRENFNDREVVVGWVSGWSVAE